METFDRKFTTARSQVYAALDSERDYQDSRWNGGKHTIEEWIIYIEDYLAEAKHILAREATQTAVPKSVHIMRKVTAMGVACMEQHGAPRREGF
jgi:hypothetical protein